MMRTRLEERNGTSRATPARWSGARAALVVLGAAIAISGCSRGESRAETGGATSESADVVDAEAGADSTAKRLAPLPVEGYVVERGDFVEDVRATGRAEADRRAELSCAVGGVVTGVDVAEGDRVRRGQALLTLDPRTFEIARDQARARLARALSDFDLLGLADSTLSAERRRLIEDRNGITEARAALARAEYDLAQCTLRAPFDGEIGDVRVVVGEWADAARPALTLVASRPARLRVEVLEADFGRLHAGAPAVARFPAYPGETFAGTIDALEPELDPERGTGFARVVLPNGDGRVRPGMYADVEIAAVSHADRLAVPREALLERDRRLLVFRATDGRAEWQYVETGLESRTLVEITSGLSPGDTVLVDGHQTLAHAAPVKVRLR
ncbi:MAG: efflux RND transporter periplasmic adaptor subunit [Gemmatimonadetes bacterium]|nr:efflux RND transporter periplasmic adaptor subunit [Gemmatimonadota bacterium]